MRILIVVLVGACLFTGCAKIKSWLPFSPKQKKSEPLVSSNNPVVTAVTSDSGKVAKVNSNARFVVLTFPFGGVPPTERRLNVYRNGLKVAELKVTGPQRDNNTVADITDGEVQVHDEVRPE